MISEGDSLFQQLFELIRDIHHATLKKPANETSFRGQGRLVYLLANHENVSQRELARLAHVKPGSISEVLERLEKGQIINRWRDDTDRRVVRVRLTATGRTLYQENLASRQRFERELLRTVTDEERQVFIKVIQKIHHQLEETNKDQLSAQEKEREHA